MLPRVAEAERDRILSLLQAGHTFRECATLLGKKEATVRSMVRRYEPYIRWRTGEKQKVESERDSARNRVLMLAEQGESVKAISQMVGIPRNVVNDMIDINRIERKRCGLYIHNEDRKDVERHVMVEDVERFSKSIYVGEDLCYAVNAAGLEIYGRVTAKYPHFAVLDCGNIDDDGCYEWNWLAVMNKDRIPKIC